MTLPMETNFGSESPPVSENLEEQGMVLSMPTILTRLLRNDIWPYVAGSLHQDCVPPT